MKTSIVSSALICKEELAPNGIETNEFDENDSFSCGDEMDFDDGAV